MRVLIKRVDPRATLPAYAKAGDAGIDLVAIEESVRGEDHTKQVIEYRTGLAIEIPEGYVGLIFPRSSIYRKDNRMCNAVGVIDSGYRGEIKVMHDVLPYAFQRYRAGDRIAQLIILPYPQIELELTDELSDTNRGAGGFGSTGN